MNQIRITRRQFTAGAAAGVATAAIGTRRPRRRISAARP